MNKDGNKLLKKSSAIFFMHKIFKYLGICSFSVIYQCKADVFIFTMVPNLKHSLVPVRSYLPENMGRSQSESAKINPISRSKDQHCRLFNEVLH